MKASPYRLLGESERSLLKTRVEEALGRWREAWLGDAACAVLAVMPASEFSPAALGAPGGASLERFLGPDKWVAVFAGRRLADAIAAAFAGEPAGTATPLVSEAVDSSLAALCEELLGARAASEGWSNMERDAALRSAARAGSGAAAALVEVAGERLGLVLGRDLVPANAAAPRATPKGGVASRAQSILGGRVQVRVVAGSAEVEVAALSCIAPGDVILLDTALDAPFGLVNTEGLAVARGHLGSRGGRKAFQFTS